MGFIAMAATAAITVAMGGATEQADEANAGRIAPQNEPTFVPVVQMQPSGAVRVDLVIDGQLETMLLKPHSVRSDNFRVLAADKDETIEPGSPRGLIEIEPPPARTYRGALLGRPGSRVAASISEGRVRASIRLGPQSQELISVQPAAGGDGGGIPHVATRGDEIPAGNWQCGIADCEHHHGNAGQEQAEAIEFPMNEAHRAMTSSGGPVCGAIAEVAFDADYTYFQLLDHSIDETIADIEAVMNAVNFIYEFSTAIEHEITAIVIRTTEDDDPYQETSYPALLEEFKAYWNEAYSDIPRATAHLMTDRDDGSLVGYAPIGTLCDVEESYGISRTLASDVFVHRVALTAHELGHSWSAQHCLFTPMCAIMHPFFPPGGVSASHFSFATIEAIVSHRQSVTCLQPAALDQWTAIDDGASVDAPVHAVAVDHTSPSGDVYFGGEFTTAGGIAAAHIARFDGNTWTSLADGLNGTVRAIAIMPDGDEAGIIAAGEFTLAGGETSLRVARFDGESWHAMGNGFNATVHDIAVFDDGTGPAIYAAGEFTGSGASDTSHIARFSNGLWEAVGSGTDGPVYALHVHDGDASSSLVAGGSFTAAGGAAAAGLAMWDGANWQPIGEWPGGTVHSLATVDHGDGPVLYAGGEIPWPGFQLDPNIAGWDGRSWFVPAIDGATFSGNSPLALAAASMGGQDVLAAGGAYFWAGGTELVFGMAQWIGSAWKPIGGGVNGQVNVIATGPSACGDGLYVGGAFDAAGGLAASNIARWHNTGPGILNHPNDQDVQTGDSVTFSVDAAGGDLTHQWRRDGAALRDDERISGTDSPTLTIDPVFLSDAGVYDVVVSGTCGYVTSQPANLTVELRPGDLTGNGKVGVPDLLVLLGQWGACADCEDCITDLTGNCAVGVPDLLVLVNNWTG